MLTRACPECGREPCPREAPACVARHRAEVRRWATAQGLPDPYPATLPSRAERRAAKDAAWKAAVAKVPPGPMADALALLDRPARKPEGS